MRVLEFITGHVVYNPAYTSKFQLKTTTVRSMVAFQPYELEYLRLLFDAIMKNPMRELQENVALNLSKKVKKKKVTLSQSESIIEKFIEYKWLIYSKDKDIRLSTRL